MAEVAKAHRNGGGHHKVAEKPDNIPDIIEERRKDSEGRIFSNRYLRGKLLGKVRIDLVHSIRVTPPLSNDQPWLLGGGHMNVNNAFSPNPHLSNHLLYSTLPSFTLPMTPNIYYYYTHRVALQSVF